MAKKLVWLNKDGTTTVDRKKVRYGDSFDPSKVNKDILESWKNKNIVGDKMITEKDISATVEDRIKATVDELKTKHASEIEEIKNSIADEAEAVRSNVRDELYKDGVKPADVLKSLKAMFPEVATEE